MPVRRGTVQSFDAERGLGVVRDTQGSDYPFHCTQIAGGLRTISVGANVGFGLAPGALGEWEATDVEELG